MCIFSCCDNVVIKVVTDYRDCVSLVSIRPKNTPGGLKAYREASKQSAKINKRDTQMHRLIY